MTAGTAITMTAVLATVLTERAAGETAATMGGGVVLVIVALLPSCLMFGRAIGSNPPVGIGPRQLPPCRACGHLRLRGPQPHIPPTPSVRVGGGGLMKGTPRNILFMLGVGILVGWRSVIHHLRMSPCALLQPPAITAVVLVAVTHTLVVVPMSVTTTIRVRRQGRRFRSNLSRSRVPSNAPNTVRVEVTMPMADEIMMDDGDV